MSKSKITVLLPEAEFAQFDEYCGHEGYKKSTLIARLIREHLQRVGFRAQREMVQSPPPIRQPDSTLTG